mgnify:CR=1 FL=1
MPIDEYPESGWDKTMDTNVKGVFFLTKAMLPLLRKAGTPEDPARVINISSIEAFQVPLWENYAYPASKAAVAQLTKHLAKMLSSDHITVNALAPGLFPSRMTKFVFDNSEIADEVNNHIPLGRAGEPQDMAGPAIFLSSRAGAWMTGSIVVVDGAQRAVHGRGGIHQQPSRRLDEWHVADAVVPRPQHRARTVSLENLLPFAARNDVYRAGALTIGPVCVTTNEGAG